MTKKMRATFAVAFALASFAFASPANASTPVPLPAALHSSKFSQQWNGAELVSFGPGPNQPGNCTSNSKEVTVNKDGYAQILTNGTVGDCADIESKHEYPTVPGYVYESRIYFSNFTQWDAYWMYGSNWPTAGEIDAVEGGPGVSDISYHYEGPNGPASMSSCNSSNNCDSSASPLTSEPHGNPEVIKPGWHTIDISFGKDSIGVWYDGALYGTVSGPNVLDHGSGDDPFWITWGTGSCDMPTNADVCNQQQPPDPGNIQIAWERIFT